MKKNMKKKNAKAGSPTATKKRGLDRENKDVTCAVRLPESMYNRLYKLAQSEGSSLSDIIREALGVRMDAMEEVIMERELKKARYEAEMAKLTAGS
jgi:predicted DNA-binding protein